MVNGKKAGVISLGCDKNRVDTEKMLSVLSQRHTIVNRIEDADIVIINTCAFLKSSREESIGEILSAGELKNRGAIEKIIVTGCLPQKFIGDVFDELPEVDAFLGVSDYSLINEAIDRIYNGERVNAVGIPREECGEKRVLTTNGYAYLKIADGCSNFCTYCLIPKIRGKYRSVPKEDLIEEARNLGEVKELILVAQDLTRYGEDLPEKSSLPDLIRNLSALKNIRGIRLLYCYPEGVTDELIREFQSNAKMIRYIDIPLQHASDRILKLMNRKGTGKTYLDLIEKLKREVRGIAIRSTFITGFPTETEEDVSILVDFLKKARLFNAGFFKYSREEGTAAYKLDGQIKEGEKTRRLKKLYSVQKAVVKQNYKELVGKTFPVVAEGFDGDQLVYYGRAYFNAPDIDGKVYFFSGEEVCSGDTVNVKILRADGYDLYGERV
ncbi:MAG: 30S ribosomal protein S12 methylthiotransferase RimO [Candidatus Borkfalkiaceae bacterium]|nr:30S ribosomal protein S12 methylthiotransferase RimO [Christensenellaceae bacterium]